MNILPVVMKMRLLTLKFKIIIGVILAVLILCAGYSKTIVVPSVDLNNEQEIGKIEYKGKFLTPVENLNVVNVLFLSIARIEK